jgi:plastocyanin
MFATHRCAIGFAITFIAAPFAAAEENSVAKAHDHMVSMKMTTQAALPPEAPCTMLVSIRGYSFNDGNPVQIRVGDSVIWTNSDPTPHTVSSDDNSTESFDSGYIEAGHASPAVAFLTASSVAGFPYHCNVHAGMNGRVVVTPSAEGSRVQRRGCLNDQQSPSIHSMVVMGSMTELIYLHHLALFRDPNHQFEVTLEGKLGTPAARAAYALYRASKPDALCILDPEFFILTELRDGKRKSFKATFFDGAWDARIPGLQDVDVDVTRIIRFRKFAPEEQFPKYMEYQLFGNATEVFLAHHVTGRPDFTETARLASVPLGLTLEMIASSPVIAVPSKRIARGGTETIDTAVMNNGTHILMAPPTGVLRPSSSLANGETFKAVFPDGRTREVTIATAIYFDARILNE